MHHLTYRVLLFANLVLTEYGDCKHSRSIFTCIYLFHVSELQNGQQLAFMLYTL